jgi:hypothetical protein
LEIDSANPRRDGGRERVRGRELGGTRFRCLKRVLELDEVVHQRVASILSVASALSMWRRTMAGGDGGGGRHTPVR